MHIDFNFFKGDFSSLIHKEKKKENTEVFLGWLQNWKARFIHKEWMYRTILG